MENDFPKKVVTMPKKEVGGRPELSGVREKIFLELCACIAVCFRTIKCI